MLSSLSVIASGQQVVFEDRFIGDSLSSAWTAPSWIAGGLPPVFTGGSLTATGKRGAVLKSINIDTGQAYYVNMYIVPQGGQHNGTYEIFLRMNDLTPVGTTDGAICSLNLSGATGIFSGAINVYVSGVLTSYAFTGGTDGGAYPGLFEVVVTANTVACYWRGTLLKSQEISAPVGERVGFSVESTVTGYTCLVSSFALLYKEGVTNLSRKTYLMASSNGVLYKELNYGHLTAVSSSLTIASDRYVMAQERAMKLYIADWGRYKIEGTDGTIDAGGTILDSASVSDWSALSISANDDMVELTNADGLVNAGTYKIQTIAAESITLASSAGGAGGCTFKILRGPKVYDNSADALTLITATVGSIPVGSKVLCLYRDRLVWAIAQAWYMSRQGTPTDYNYGATDAQRAVYGQGSNAGELGENITALCPFKDDYLVFGCQNSTWVLRGDPAYGGSIDAVSRNVGILSAKSWCYGPSGELIFISRDGLYVMQGLSEPQSLSHERLPIELKNISEENYDVFLEYDVKERGVHIYLTGKNEGPSIHWWFDWQYKSFWKVKTATNYEPTATFSLRSEVGNETGVLLGGRDGYVRRFDRDNETDDGTEITSYILYGPIRLGDNEFDKGVLLELIGTRDWHSGTITWEVYVGTKAEDAVNSSTVFETGTWTRDGLNPTARPWAGGGAYCLKLKNTGSRRWAIEQVLTTLEDMGRNRLLT